jgi:hypothetical protein
MENNVFEKLNEKYREKLQQAILCCFEIIPKEILEENGRLTPEEKKIRRSDIKGALILITVMVDFIFFLFPFISTAADLTYSPSSAHQSGSYNNAQISQQVTDVFNRKEHPTLEESNIRQARIKEYEEQSRKYRESVNNRIPHQEYIPRSIHPKSDLRKIDLNSIPDVPSEYHFRSNNPELQRIYQNLYKINPRFKSQKEAREIGLGAVEEADTSYANGEEEDGDLFKEIAKEMLDFSIGLDPITAVGRGAYELYTGKNLITHEPLTTFQRSLAFIAVVSLGTSNSSFKILSMAEKIAPKAKTAIISGQNLLKGPAGKMLAHIRRTGGSRSEEGFKRFNKEADYYIPPPKDNRVGRVMPEEIADEVISGRTGLAADPVAFVADSTDIPRDAVEIPKRLGLFDKNGNYRKINPKKDIILEFEMKEIIELPLDIEPPDFIPGGYTSGGAREHIIYSDALERELIIPSSFKKVRIE